MFWYELFQIFPFAVECQLAIVAHRDKKKKKKHYNLWPAQGYFKKQLPVAVATLLLRRQSSSDSFREKKAAHS